MFVILKWVTSAPSLALRLSTMSPDCVSSSVVMLAACGVSPTGVIVIVEVATPLWAATDVPFWDDSTSKVAAVLRSASGRRRRWRPCCGPRPA